MLKNVKMASLNRFDVFLSNTEKTFQFDNDLPSLPLPTLDKTLEKYLESVKPFLTDEDFSRTKRIVEKFARGEGKELHAKLLEKAKTERNWVEDWWEKYAYLTIRESLIPNVSMIGTRSPLEEIGLLNVQHGLKEAAFYVYYLLEFWVFLRQQRVAPVKAVNKTRFSMSQYRHLFNTTRIPGNTCDSIQCYFKTEDEGDCPTHIIVLNGGHIFELQILDRDGKLITPLELERQFRFIKTTASDLKEGQSVGCLTCDNRTKWATNREWLSKLSIENQQNLEKIGKAILVVSLEDEIANSHAESLHKSLCENFSNRWPDKSMNVVFFANGLSTVIADHVAFDGIVSVSSTHYVELALSETKLRWNGSRDIRDLPEPQLLNFLLDPTLEKEIARVKCEEEENKAELIVIREVFDKYGKKFIQKQKLHPDSYIQMALQLAYYRLHKRPVATYETATTREYYNGRTETVRSCTMEALAWVQSMLDNKISKSKQKELLVTAIEKHNSLMKDAKQNAGCDRHLFGLQCLAIESGLPLPELFKDPAWVKSGGNGNFILSTSLSGYTRRGGGVAPMCTDGYGAFYNIMDDRFQFYIFVWRKSPVTSAVKLYEALEQSLTEMAEVLESNKSKL